MCKVKDWERREMVNGIIIEWLYDSCRSASERDRIDSKIPNQFLHLRV